MELPGWIRKLRTYIAFRLSKIKICVSEDSGRKPDSNLTQSSPEELPVQAPEGDADTAETGASRSDDEKQANVHRIEANVKASANALALERPPYYFQLGLDFGTSYCKCIVRNIATNMAWVHIPNRVVDKEYPFLIPSAMEVRNRAVCKVQDNKQYPEKYGLPHVKVALVEITSGMQGPALGAFKKVVGETDASALQRFVGACAVYLIGGIVEDVRQDIRTKFPDFGMNMDDYLAVSLAIPVKDNASPQIARMFQAVLNAAYENSKNLGGHPPADVELLRSITPNIDHAAQDGVNSDRFRCFIYPEVSACVQGFIRSPVAQPGLYMFSETGAATVDQSVFIFHKSVEGGASLNYLFASVLYLGSSHIDQLAAELEGNDTPGNRERWRRLKEAGNNDMPLNCARKKLGGELMKASCETLFKARRKLPQPRQFEEIRVVFGGGGHCNDPYRKYVLKPFEEEVPPYQRIHNHFFTPPVIGMPIPTDLEPEDKLVSWMKRLWVSYGLSFYPGDFPNHRFPDQIPNALPQPVLSSLPAAITKDVC